MKQILFSAFVALAFSAWAQAPAKEAAKPEPMKEAAKAEPMKEAAKAEPVKEAAKPAVETPKQAAAGPKKVRRWNEDARHCLERASNTEIIKCAEEFL
jgi:hypothetical protein